VRPARAAKPATDGIIIRTHTSAAAAATEGASTARKRGVGFDGQLAWTGRGARRWPSNEDVFGNSSHQHTNMTAAEKPSREVDATPSLVRMHGVDEAAGDEENPSKRIRGALGIMYGSARTGCSLPSSDLDTPEQLVAAWTQYRDAYGNNGLAGGGSRSTADAGVDDALFAMAAAAPAPVGPAKPAADAARAQPQPAVAVESPAALAHALFQMV
jgi:hypothetical protein